MLLSGIAPKKEKKHGQAIQPTADCALASASSQPGLLHNIELQETPFMQVLFILLLLLSIYRSCLSSRDGKPIASSLNRRRQCWECRRRRLVCDFSLPGCRKCYTAGVECPGYDEKKPLKWVTTCEVDIPASEEDCSAEYCQAVCIRR